jgi:NADP-dependent 3-hydroxy acid dehydrogenase YdfG
MTAISGSAAVVTGAASGIGRALALELAARGADLALADRDEAGLQAVAAEIGKVHKVKLTTHRVDVGEPAEIIAFAQAAVTAHPRLNIVVNNAGVALLGGFTEIDQAQMDWLFNINFWGVVHSCRAFLPALSQKPEAHIVNLSSIFGNGCRDHTVLPYANSAVRLARQSSLTRFARPAITMRADAAASTASHPAFVTTRDPPLLGDEMARAGRTDLPDGESEIFLAKGIDSFLSRRLICPSGGF